MGLSLLILLLVFREERLVAEGKVPLGRLRRLWFGKERRRAPRYRVDWSVRYQRLREEPKAALEMRDASQGGMGLVVEEFLQVGSVLQLELNLPNEPNRLTLNGQVAWSREVPEKKGSRAGRRSFLVGIQFHPLDPEKEKKLAAVLKAR